MGYCYGGVGESPETAEASLNGIQEKSEVNVCETNEERAEKMELSLDDYQEILSEFITLREVDMQELGDVLAGRDLDSVSQLAHKIKGSAKMLALEDIAALASNMEQAAREKDLSGAEIHFQSLKSAFSFLLERQQKNREGVL